MIVKESRTYELDDKIAMSIIKLNQKGFVTVFCCEGHPEGAYIAFDRSTSLVLDNYLPINIKKFGKILYNHPINWVIDRCEYDNLYYKYFIIRRYFTEEEYLTNTDEQLTDMVVKELDMWIDSLPNRNNDVEYEIIKL